ncbi:MAG TPA: hypothetical protein VM692_08910 [Gammaproteobacteria bacterium]|nr:hypothetical protein [Gammaproteobacteria bacterium]
MARRRGKRAERAPNTAQLRGAMRSGRTPSIDSAHEPAAASFDTDDEAAGRPAQTAAIEQALANEGRVPPQVPGGARRSIAAPLWIFAAAMVAAVLAWILLS